ncbi:hypothetical protein HOLleu_13023 [Holothuria leucospilota]|uniref:Reverse transcriptase domain-containing protein n=1 Tax=Holothuria leucospilota TaxID=206669 RepID=A0A9Q1CC75_HOLLE|nr:hypothetical protein HOLleu_13023 [Holothuria leucospilota]
MSCMSQESVLYLLCIVYASNLDADSLGKAIVFADDNKSYKDTSTHADDNYFLVGLGQVFRWWHDCEMLFNVNKCKIYMFVMIYGLCFICLKGSNGVRDVLEILRDELKLCMALCGEFLLVFALLT